MQSKQYFMILFLLAFSLSGFSKGRSYTYIDGNNNSYTITQDSLIYKAIQPSESSSGTYSGGDSKSVRLSEIQFEKIELLIKSVLKNKSIHESTRQMGFGTLITGKQTIFLNSNSEQKNTLELTLKEYLK